jgi:hypothetical protein
VREGGQLAASFRARLTRVHEVRKTMLVTPAVPQAQDEPQTAARAGRVLAYRLAAFTA